jgi:hypothetical protein
MDYLEEYEKALEAPEGSEEKKAFYAKFPLDVFEKFAKAVKPKDVTTALRIHMQLYVKYKESKKKK